MISITDSRDPGPRSTVAVSLALIGVVLCAISNGRVPYLVAAAVILSVMFGVANRLRRERERRITARDAALVLLSEEATTTALRTTIPPVEATIPLADDEVCLWAGEAEWFELRPPTPDALYDGPRATFSGGAPVDSRVRGYAARLPIRLRAWEQLDAGRAYVTTRRLYFVGSRKTTVLALRDLRAVGIVDGLVELDTGASVSPHLRVGDALATVAGLVQRGRLLAAANSPRAG